MKLFIASDHAGFELKQLLLQKSEIFGQKIEWVDLGCDSAESVNYPSYAEKLAKKVLEAQKQGLSPINQAGILICGSGVGMSIAANRFDGIRAVLALRPDVAALSRKHNASNVLCLGARVLAPLEVEMIVAEWVKTDFEGGRHQKRVEQMDFFKTGEKQ